MRQKHGRDVRVSRNMVGQPHLEATLFLYLFQYLVATAVARNREHTTVLCQTPILLDDTFGNVQQTDVRFGVGLLALIRP